MKCLTISQPWASLIISSVKRWENRSWFTNYRGPLLIHAGKSTNSLHYVEALLASGIDVPDDLPMGVILGQVDLLDCLKLADVPAGEAFVEGPFCLRLANAKALSEPIPYVRQLSLYDVPERVLVGASWKAAA